MRSARALVAAHAHALFACALVVASVASADVHAAQDARPTTTKPAKDGEAPAPPSDVSPTSSPSAAPSSSTERAEPVDEERLRVVVPDFVAASDGVLAAELETVTATVVYQLSQVARLHVVSAADIRHMLDLEASRQVMGCSEDTSCLTNVAGALGAPLLVAGQVTRLGGRLAVALVMIDVTTAAVIKRARAEARDLLSLARALRPAVNELTSDYGGVPGAAVDESRTTFMRALADRANDPDTVMLFAVMAMGVVSPFFLPLVWLLPCLQALMLWTLGDDLAGREYPAWALAIPAGYAMLFLGTVLSAAFTIGAIATVDLTQVSQTLAFAASGTIFVTLFVVEPLAVWIAGTLWARDLDIVERANDSAEEAAATDGDASDATTAPADDEAAATDDEAEPHAGDALRAFFSLAP